MFGNNEAHMCIPGTLTNSAGSEEDGWEGEGDWQIGKKYLERHIPIRNTCYSCSLTPLNITKTERSPSLSKHQGKLMKKPRRRVTNHFKTLSFPVGPQITQCHLQHITYLAGEKTTQILTAVWLLFVPSALPLQCRSFRQAFSKQWWIGGQR